MGLVSHGSDHRNERGMSFSSLTDEDFVEVEEGGKREIMSVELALKRERAYAAKVTELLKLPRHHNNEGDEKFCAPVQAPSLDPKPGTDRTPPSETSCLPPPELQQTRPKEPPLQIQSSQRLPSLPPTLQTPQQRHALQIQSSQRRLPSLPPPTLQTPQQRHPLQIPQSRTLSGLPPPSKTLQLEQPCPPPPSFHLQSSYKRPIPKRNFQMEPISLVCQQCQLSCSSVSTLKQHYRGRKHRSRVEELRLQRNGGVQLQNLVTEPLWCDVCQIRCMNEDCYIQHLKGKKHASCVQAISVARGQVGGSTSNGVFG